MVGSKLSTFIGERRDPEELLSRLIAAGLLAESVNLQRVRAAIEAAFAAEARAFESHGFGRADEWRAQMLLDQKLLPYLSPRGVALMKTDDP
jgi:hypothetical protein